MSTLRRWLAAITTVFAVTGGIAVATGVPAFAAACTTSSPTGSCGPYNDPSVYTSSNGQDLVVQNDFSSIPQTLTANGDNNWTVSATSTGTSVKSYPATQVTYTTTADKPDPVSDFGSTLTNSWSNVEPSNPSGMDYEFAMDEWLGDPSQTSWTNDQEIMIWTDVHGQVPSGSDTGTHYTDSNGANWQVWACGCGGSTTGTDKTISFVRQGNAATGSVDLMGFFNYLTSNGYTSSGFGIDQLNYGLEICSTGGSAQTFGINSYTLVKNGSSGPQSPAVTTNAASNVGQTGATLNGSVNPEGQSASYQFDYGTTTSYGTSVPSPAGNAGSGTSTVNESSAISGLSSNTTYHYRIEATNATGTSFGSDQTFTTSSSGGTTVGVGDYRGNKAANTRSLSWSIGVGTAGNRAVLAEATVGDTNDVGCGQTVTDNGVTMTKLAVIHTNNQSAGYMDIWGDVNPASGTHTFQLTVTGCDGGTPKELTGGSIEFAGVNQSSPFSAVTSATGSGSVASAAAGSASGDMMAGFAANGSAVNSATSPSVSRFTENQDNLTGAGNSAGATSASTGSNVTMAWGVTSDWWAVGVVQVQHA